MTRPKNPESVAKEAQLQAALTAILNDKHTCHSATKEFDIPRQTLYDRWKEKPPRNKAQTTNRILSHAEEKKLVQ